MVFAWKAYDPFTAALKQSSARLGHQDYLDEKRVAADLIRFYEGNQMGYLDTYLSALVEDSVQREHYRKLADTYNVTKLVIDTVSVFGKRPLALSWDNENDAALWEEVAHERAEFDSFVDFLGRRVELVKTATVCVSYDDERERVGLDVYAANTLDVGYRPTNRCAREPDFYRIWLGVNPISGAERYQTWDFEDAARPVEGEDEERYSNEPRARRTGITGYVYETEGESLTPVRDPEPVEIIDPRSGQSVIPFVAFRTDYAGYSYYIDDGQQDLLTAQKTVNRTATHKRVAEWWGTSKQPIFTGGGWKDANGKMPSIAIGWSRGINCPTPTPGGPAPDVRWDGPASPEIIKALGEALAERRDDLATSFHISPGHLRFRADASSGVALWLENQGLRAKLGRQRTLFQRPIERVIELMVLIWNAKHEGEPARQFSGAPFRVDIPDVQESYDPEAELRRELTLAKQGVIPWKRVVARYNPDADAATIEALAANAERLNQMEFAAKVAKATTGAEGAEMTVEMPPAPQKAPAEQGADTP